MQVSTILTLVWLDFDVIFQQINKLKLEPHGKDFTSRILSV